MQNSLPVVGPIKVIDVRNEPTDEQHQLLRAMTDGSERATGTSLNTTGTWTRAQASRFTPSPNPARNASSNGGWPLCDAGMSAVQFIGKLAASTVAVPGYRERHQTASTGQVQWPSPSDPTKRSGNVIGL